MEISKEQSKAQENFGNAFQSFARVAVSSFGYFLENLEDQVRDTVRGVSSEAVEGVREIKRELNVADAVRKDPLLWMAGAAVAGGGSVIVLKTLARSGGGLRWLVWAGEVGFALLSHLKKQSSSLNVYQPTNFDRFGG